MPQDQLRPKCLEGSQSVSLPKGATVFRAGDPCRNFYLIESGSVRVDLMNSEGKSILLYRIGANETCVLTTSCLLSHESYSAEAVTESDVTALVIPANEFQARIASSEQFREIVFRSFSSRLTRLMAKVDEVSFASLNSRLAKRLLELAGERDFVETTHERLAQDLGSAREVIGRKLTDWEKQGLIARHRGSIDILSRPALTVLCGQRD
ncbi:Crp/Fnr family transcriptional regulator [Roseibium porphyridii]|uniref:Crp/Fnr family transcriptional regulator n=1 Tax=Roseibium porphyridii TaxID=2866279 RepID=A0ABY8F1A9_9HYPH|nr:Crp/Fnr family transcriptional regulator [Roseibium sp. KMA01]WFE88549.1 Crp/Fnr family transcriptional regulator [Roseibium sp. KMA01]